jgi:hypothetical protein
LSHEEGRAVWRLLEWIGCLMRTHATCSHVLEYQRIQDPPLSVDGLKNLSCPAPIVS